MVMQPKLRLKHGELHSIANYSKEQLAEAPHLNARRPTKCLRSKWFFGVVGLTTLAFVIAAVILLVPFDINGRLSASSMAIVNSIIDAEYFITDNQIGITAENACCGTEIAEMYQVFTDFSDGTYENLILLNNGENELKLKTTLINFAKNIVADNFLSARSVHAVDIDQDGKIDILGAARQAHRIAWWKNEGINLETGKVSFTEFIIDSNFKGAFSVHGVDVDNDGYKDVIGASLYDDQIAWWRNNQNGTFSARKIIDNNFNGAIFTYSADLDNDGYMDILAAAESVDQIAWWRNQGGGVFSPRIVIGNKFNGARSVHAADVDRDGDLDVLGTARFADQVFWWENKGEGKEFIEHVIDDNFDGPRSVHATDMDNDGDIDILAAARYAHQIALWENNGEQNFTKIIVDDRFEGATNVFSADLNQDGKKDIIAAAVYADKIAWWQNKGNGRFTRFIIGENFKGATFVYAEDINGDKYKDILVPAVFDNQIGLWINNPKHQSAGVFISPVISKKENMKLTGLSWEGLVPENTFLRFQVRSGNNLEELEAASWHGPFSTDDYYTISGSDINPVHNDHFLIQYRVFFETGNLLTSPRLNKVSLIYSAAGMVKKNECCQP